MAGVGAIGRIGRIGAFGVGGGGWSPSILGSSLLAWWTADRADLVTVSGAAVTNWKDVRNAYDMAQSVSASRPTYSATGFNGFPGITFDGVDDCLEMASQPFGTGAIDVEVWAIVQQDALVADTGDRMVFAFGADTVNPQARVQRQVLTTNRAAARIGTGAANFNALSAADFSGRALIRVRFTPTVTYVSQDNGAEGSIAVVPGIGATRARIGAAASNFAGNFWQGKIRDILVTGPLSAGQAAAVNAWALPRRAP